MSTTMVFTPNRHDMISNSILYFYFISQYILDDIYLLENVSSMIFYNNKIKGREGIEFTKVFFNFINDLSLDGSLKDTKIIKKCALIHVRRNVSAEKYIAFYKLLISVLTKINNDLLHFNVVLFNPCLEHVLGYVTRNMIIWTRFYEEKFMKFGENKRILFSPIGNKFKDAIKC
ncbi:hypothetical protein [Heterosigma akashiwo virus 01]|uniref:Uncharacterized protein n=1 Tax=Heterosigma akashiwo virus 01 TaxID=97195 RepID=A0A1C9C5B0_HAV01|nr:hypothetical protein D1R72_gp151 [Heterosigma akashiwo virus 01]AOM63482.1 hypothetical protein [Heterosigma akashiwo virus 01]